LYRKDVSRERADAYKWTRRGTCALVDIPCYRV